MNKSKEDYVEWVGEDLRGNNTIWIHCYSKEKQKSLKKIGAKCSIFNKKALKLKYSNDEELAYLFSKIRDIGIAFAGGQGGWPPADIFIDLRNKGMIDGKFNNIMWSGPNQTIKLEK